MLIIVSPSGYPPTLSDRRSSDSYLRFVLLPPCEALVVGLELRSEAAQISKNCGAPRARWEVILGAPNASWELRFASKRLLASDFEALEVSGAPRGDQESAQKLPKKLQVTIHQPYGLIMSSQRAAGSPQRAPKELLESQNEAQRSPKELHGVFGSSENDLKIKNGNVYKTSNGDQGRLKEVSKSSKVTIH